MTHLTRPQNITLPALHFAMRVPGILLGTGLVSDEIFDDTYVNSGCRNRDFFSGLPKCTGLVRDNFFNETYVNSTRRSRLFCRVC